MKLINYLVKVNILHVKIKNLKRRLLVREVDEKRDEKRKSYRNLQLFEQY
jgi:hypothetical protein